MNQFQHIQTQLQYQPNQQSSASLNPFSFMYPPVSKGHRPSISMSSDDSVRTPTQGPQTPLRVPKFERTYTDAFEDELFDESSSSASQSVISQGQVSRHDTPNFAYPRITKYYMDKNARAPVASPSRHQQSPLSYSDKSANMMYQSGQPENSFYDLLGNQKESQRLSSSQVADSVRRLQVPGRTTVSPREAFLDYPDSADFREKSLFNKSASPYSQTHESQDSHHQSSDSSPSIDDYISDRVQEAQNPVSSTAAFPLSDLRANLHPMSAERSSRSMSSSTPLSGLPSGDMSVDSAASSESEYDPTASSRRASRSSGRSSLAKPFACVDCGKRFDKSQPLQLHRRNSHGRGSGLPSLNQHRFSNTAHRCDWEDPATGKMCNTIFSRPYDLIRHYETKHSAKRQEFICPHCEDKKSFSRSDALRRHLRVKHPSSGRK